MLLDLLVQLTYQAHMQAFKTVDGCKFQEIFKKRDSKLRKPLILG